MRKFLLTLILALPALAGTAAVDSSDPARLIETASQAMLAELDAHRAEFRAEPKKLYKVIDDVLLPHFDTEYAARLVLGRYWRDATPQQRQRFVTAFYHSLLMNYGDALIDFTSDRLRVLPYNGPSNQDRATVRTEVMRSNGEKVPVNYSLRRSDGAWKAWDVVIEGISYVKSFREDFGAEIGRNGLDAVIARLEKDAVQRGGKASASK
ncbi:MAG: ABC transporter substrate-binding protein [Steroidobacteraceae bacterium]